MLTAAILSSFWHVLCRAPDFIGYVGGLARDSPYFTTNRVNSTMDSIQIAQILRKEYVKVGDVQGEQAVGKLLYLCYPWNRL